MARKGSYTYTGEHRGIEFIVSSTAAGSSYQIGTEAGGQYNTLEHPISAAIKRIDEVLFERGRRT